MKAIAISTACLAAGAVFFQIRMVTPLFLTLFWAFGTVLVAVSRIALRETLDQMLKRGRNLRYVLFVGTNSRAMQLARRIKTEPERGYRVLGFVDDDWHKRPNLNAANFQRVCGTDGLPEFLRRNVVDEVAIYLPLRSYYERASKIARLCEQNGILIRFDGDIFSLKKAHSRAEEFAGQTACHRLNHGARVVASDDQEGARYSVLAYFACSLLPSLSWLPPWLIFLDLSRTRISIFRSEWG